MQQIYRPWLVTAAGLEFLCLDGLEKDLSLVDLLPQLAVMLRELILLLFCLDLLMLGEVRKVIAFLHYLLLEAQLLLLLLLSYLGAVVLLQHSFHQVNWL